MIFGIYGATRAEELTRVSIADVKEQGNVFVIKIPKTKTNICRSFTVEDDYAEIIRKYVRLRPANVENNRFFLNYQKGKCTVQPIGRNKFLAVPKLVADFLALPDSETYTGHSFRRTSATLLADGGADIITLQQHGGWRSTNVVQGYVQNSITKKRKIGSLISDQLCTSSSKIISQTKVVNVRVIENIQSNIVEMGDDVQLSSVVDNVTPIENIQSNIIEMGDNVQLSSVATVSNDQKSVNAENAINMQKSNKSKTLIDLQQNIDESCSKKKKEVPQFNFSNFTVKIYYN